MNQLFPNRKPIPNIVKQEVKERADNCCENCGHAGRLEYHHLRYYVEACNSNYHREWFGLVFGKERSEDLLLLCRECHHQKHLDFNGDFWADPEEMDIKC